MRLTASPISLKEANSFVREKHRHHPPVHRDKFRVACIDEYGNIVGVAQVGRPVSRILDDGNTVEVVRLCTDGTPNACSFLYARCANAARELGYSKIITYILESESGASLKASGWTHEADTKGHSWDCRSRPRNTDAPICNKQRWALLLKG